TLIVLVGLTPVTACSTVETTAEQSVPSESAPAEKVEKAAEDAAPKKAASGDVPLETGEEPDCE
ncbi:MAG: hypothetical protein KDJ38_19640, partial [Gammaproteobacteria bacterium]|nr:hypothetical protein [Gammaproteobacteria bacterium]